MKKILHIALTLWGVVTTIFFLFHILPGDPARMMLDQNENQQQLLAVRKKYGFDQPILNQYLYYWNDLSPLSIHKNTPEHYTFFSKEKYTGFSLMQIDNWTIVIKYPYLRESFQKNGKKVSQIIAQTLPNTFILAFISISIATFLGLSFGIISALNKDTFWDRFIQIISIFGMSIPSFFSAILLAWLFGFVWHKYTGLSIIGNLYEIDDYGIGETLKLKNLILPSIALGIRPLAVISQLMRNSLIEIMQMDYIRTARAKGLSTKMILWRHALKNALNPVVTALSGWFASMLAGSVFIEYIFGWNGLGKEIVDALNTLDLPIIMGAVLVISLLFILINIWVDTIYKLLDPRIK